MLCAIYNTPIRAKLVNVILKWQRKFGVAPAITGALAEYDAARLVGHTHATLEEDCAERTAVTKGYDFTFEGKRYQVKANRPSGRPGSTVTLVGKANNYEWDYLIWVLYNRQYIIQEVWKWDRQSYQQAFHKQKRISPKDMRTGAGICIFQACPACA